MANETITTGTKVRISGKVFTVKEVFVRLSRLQFDGYIVRVSFEEVDEDMPVRDLVRMDGFEVVTAQQGRRNER